MELGVESAVQMPVIEADREREWLQGRKRETARERRACVLGGWVRG